MFFPDAPGLGHEDQFDLDTDAGRHFLDALTAIRERHLDAAT